MNWCVGADASGPAGRLRQAGNPRGSGRLYPELTANLKAAKGAVFTAALHVHRLRLRIALVAGSTDPTLHACAGCGLR